MMSEFLFLENFKYLKNKGVLIRLKTTNRNSKFFEGKIAGTIDKNGYRSVSVNNKKYLIHRLIWFIENKEWPICVDHINGNKLDNRIENLRAVSNRQNSQNSHNHRKGKLVGCSFFKRDQTWMSQIVIKGKKKYLGSFPTEQKAHEAYKNALKEISC